MDNPLKYFAELRDPRVERNREHLLEEILLIAIAAVLSGAESWNDIADYGEDKREWLQDVSDASVGHSVARYVQPGVCGAGPGGDGKGLCGLGFVDCQADGGRSGGHRRQGACAARARRAKRRLVHMVSAWASATTWCWRSARSMKNPTKSRPFRSFWTRWSWQEPW